MQLQSGRSRSRRGKYSSKYEEPSESGRGLLLNNEEEEVCSTNRPTSEERIGPLPAWGVSALLVNEDYAVSFDESNSCRWRTDVRRVARTNDSGISSKFSTTSGNDSWIATSSTALHSTSRKKCSTASKKKSTKTRYESNCRKNATLMYDNYSSSSDSSSPTSFFSEASYASSASHSGGAPHSSRLDSAVLKPISGVKRTRHRLQESPQCRRQRWYGTAEVLRKSGLLDITIKTAELMRKNQKIQREIETLQKETERFVASVLSNPENRQILESIQSQAQLYEVIVPGSQKLMSASTDTLSPPFTFSNPESLEEEKIIPNILSSLNEDNEEGFEINSLSSATLH